MTTPSCRQCLVNVTRTISKPPNVWNHGNLGLCIKGVRLSAFIDFSWEFPGWTSNDQLQRNLGNLPPQGLNELHRLTAWTPWTPKNPELPATVRSQKSQTEIPSCGVPFYQIRDTQMMSQALVCSSYRSQRPRRKGYTHTVLHTHSVRRRRTALTILIEESCLGQPAKMFISGAKDNLHFSIFPCSLVTRAMWSCDQGPPSQFSGEKGESQLVLTSQPTPALVRRDLLTTCGQGTARTRVPRTTEEKNLDHPARCHHCQETFSDTCLSVQ